LLAAIALVSVVVAVTANRWEGPQPVAANPPIYLTDQTAVRVVGTPFRPNVNPRDRH
jgi:hypothetical protein